MEINYVESSNRYKVCRYDHINITGNVGWREIPPNEPFIVITTKTASNKPGKMFICKECFNRFKNKMLDIIDKCNLGE